MNLNFKIVKNRCSQEYFNLLNSRIAVVGQLKVRLGSTHWDTGGDLIDAAMVMIHPQYNPESLTYDFSLIKLAQHVTFSTIARPVRLVPANFQIYARITATVSGWGETRDPLAQNTQLRAVQLPVVARQRCNQTYQFLGGIDNTMICAGYPEGGRDSCFGDSGGPLVTAAGLQMGVVSWGVECAAPNLPGVYGRVSVARNWIKTTTGI